ncbi:hypothetical protein OG598_14805 [Micromonospora sp. NBC_00330]|uniref:hypothetical protein n=1 Tax=Micromonospora sp. NBC_00330 TaxID=2903585 RepID=UPI002E2CACC1|nr:hypothetical protein [Micromonospora sp. NBC_00330]
MLRSSPGHPVIADAIEMALQHIRRGPVVMPAGAYLVDRALTTALGRHGIADSQCSWRGSVHEVHPILARYLGCPADPGGIQAAADAAAAIGLSVQEWDRHDETRLLLHTPADYLMRHDSLFSDLLRRALGAPPLDRPTATPAHLGGHKHRTNFDIGSLLAIRDATGARTMVDLGCGPGGMVFAGRHAGIAAIGIDGDPAIPDGPWLVRQDLTVGAPSVAGGWDLGWCVEFLEHVDSAHEHHYMTVLAACQWVVATLARPGQPGHHHVNCQPLPHWRELFARYGLDHSPSLTALARSSSTMYSNFMREQGFVFVRRER